MFPGKIRISLVKLFTNPTFLIALWLGVTLICCLMKYGKYPPRYNNFIIFTHSFLHALEQLPLYIEYPAEHHDVFLYGISFTPLIAPFAIFKPFIGMIVWCLANTLLLYFAIKKLGLEKWQFAFIICLSVNDLFLAVTQQQYNIGICGMIILSYFFINQKKEFWAACMIMLGAMTKVYGIVGLAFFFFAKRPLVLIGGLIFWGIFFFILPMSFTSPQYVIGEYINWFEALTSKNALNMFTDYTNISLIGMIHKVSGNLTFSDLWVIVPGLALFVAPYVRVRQYVSENFRLLFLSSTLLFMVLFSTSTESYGYITAMVAVCIWYVSTPTREKTPHLNTALFAFCFILTSLSTTDIFPAFIRKTYVIPYALKALPCTLIWCKIIWEQLTVDFKALPETKTQPLTHHKQVLPEQG